MDKVEIVTQFRIDTVRETSDQERLQRILHTRIIAVNDNIVIFIDDNVVIAHFEKVDVRFLRDK